MEPSSLEISNLRLRLRALPDRASSGDELSDIIDEIAELGQYGIQLVPDLVAAIKRGTYIAKHQLFPIIVQLKNAELLTAAIEENQCFPNVFEKCELLKAGFHEFQQPLLDELFEVFERDDEPIRSAIVDALSVAGTASATETLRVIEYRTAARVPELNAELNTGDPETQASKQLKRGENLESREQFFVKVREAIKQVASRPDPQDLPRDQTREV